MLTDYSEQVADGVIDHYCPGVAECHAKLTMDELKLLLFPDAYTRLLHTCIKIVRPKCYVWCRIRRLERLTQVKRNPLFRECPKCNTGMTAITALPTDETAAGGNGEPVPVAKQTCNNCQHEFCFYHDDAHPGMQF
jgi:hypothetical protein